MENAVGMEEQKRGSAPENAIELAERVSRLEERLCTWVLKYSVANTAHNFKRAYL